ncbi:MAG: exodeoxyribonuclease V subunit beta [Gammaproteobacteria bacterium]|nr:exodeoxyribonuclease V subunit beta [Gammaproteobacteria bacterium]
MKPADPLAHPLDGLSLIEASAGTGKTTALVRLYLRALLVEGLGVEQILAVTYTRAATGELSVRIRKELAAATAGLADPSFPRNPSPAPVGERDSGEFLAQVIENAAGERALLKARAEAALAAFDDKAVFTIHGFCKRMLADNAFEAGAAFSSEPVEDEGGLRDEVAADFWRRRTGGGASPAYVRWLLATLESPAKLLEELHRPLLAGAALGIEPEVTNGELNQAEAAFGQAVVAARKAWHRDRDVLEPWLRESGDLNRNQYHKGTTAQLLDEWEAWLEAPPCPLLPKNFERLTLEKARASLRKGVDEGAIPDKPFFQWKLGDALKEAAESLCALWWQDTCAAALAFVLRETRRRKRETREQGYDDMLRNLHDAFDAPGGKRLARRIAGQYPLILVDEFQDTDPLQYEIFRRIHEAGKGHGLILIGDPKQAIYRFRGADVFTYLQARERCSKAGCIYSLSKNYRSTAKLLEALNALFGNSAEPFVHPDIPYVEIEPGREIPPLQGGRDAAMTILCPPDVAADENGIVNKDEAYRVAATTCADEIARLLEEGRSGRLHCKDEPVEAKHIAVLVAANFQGAMVRDALRSRGIAVAMVSNESVFASEEAESLEMVLAAVAEPGDGGLLRRALVTPLFGAAAADLRDWASDEHRWDEIVSAFREYRDCWRDRGFAVMFSRLISGQDIIGHSLARADGERVMTNLRHLAELAGEEASRHPGIAPLLAWFARERADAARTDARQLRLESDADLVHIATVHRAKGLQYPILFLPFLWYARKPRSAKNPAVLAHDGYRTVLDLGSEDIDEREKEADRETLAEEVRKTYVALTRAEHACYVTALPAKEYKQGALAYLLGMGESDELAQALGKWQQTAGDAVMLRAPAGAGGVVSSASSREYGEARPFPYRERLRQRFHVASYSLLAAGASGRAAESPDWDETVEAAPPAESAAGVHAFPAGAASGTFLHEVIEALDFESDEATASEEVQKQLIAHGFESHWKGVLSAWLYGLFRTPLDKTGCRLADIPRARRRDELEFHFLMNRLEATKLNEAVAVFAPETPRPELHFDDVAGQMKGYIDLVFEHDGRFWIADYKSNRLGSGLDAYTLEALDRAMAEHRYDLQYLIYTVAVHRYLKTRIPDYDYERHFGGVLYLFLRGMAPDAPAPRGVWHTRPALADIRRLDAYLARSRP